MLEIKALENKQKHSALAGANNKCMAEATEGLSQIRGCDFGKVINDLKENPGINTAFREGWNGKGQFICLQVPDENSFMTVPYFYITTVDGQRVPWIASQADMLATDWALTRID